jgi:cardiolipin synthase
MVIRFVAAFLFMPLLFATLQASEPETSNYPTLTGRFSDAGAQQPLLADEVYISESRFYARIRRGDEVFYSGGKWADRIQLQEATASGGFSGPYLLPLEYQQSERWKDLPENALPIRILDSGEWRDFRDYLFTGLLPETENGGIVLHFQTDDYFLYRDQQGAFQATVIENKPGEYSVVSRIPFSDFLLGSLPVLESYLTERGITDRRIAFNTGDTGAYSLPFIYVNRDLPLAVFVREAIPKIPLPLTAADPIIQTAGHVARSHITALAMRPLSSIYRLFFVAADTATEAARPVWLVNFESSDIPPVSDHAGMNLDDWENTLDEFTGRPSSSGSIRYLIDGEEFFTRLIDTVTSATKSLLIRTYIFDNDDYAEKIGDLLKRRSNDGIDVKVLLDGLGTIVSTVEKQETLPEGFEGPASVRKFLEHESRIKLRQATNPWLTGDHVKTIIIDEQIAFTGGMNIAREYRYDWHDLMMELRGPVVQVILNDFDRAWVHAGPLGDIGVFLQSLKRQRKSTADPGYPIRILFTRTDNPEIFTAQRRAARESKNHIFVENAYFTDDAMLYELAKARRRGVDVRVIMPLVTDRGPITRNNALAANAMLEHGIRVFVYPGMSHVKAAIFDGWACLGTANWDRLSFRINKELNVSTSDRRAVLELQERLFEPDFARSVEITEPFPERWSDHLIEILGDYIF